MQVAVYSYVKLQKSATLEQKIILIHTSHKYTCVLVEPTKKRGREG